MPPRKHHTKSRNGCTGCKQRRVKCDEVAPSCFNCRRHGVQCSLAFAGEHTQSLPSRRSSATARSRDARHNSTPESSYISTVPAKQIDLGHVRNISLSFSGAPRSELLNLPPEDLWMRDQELMHHYCTMTAPAMSTREDVRQVWQVTVPREAYRNSYLLHGVLAIAAGHKAYLTSGNRPLYLSLSDYHFTVGLEGFHSSLCDIGHDNWRPMYMFAFVVTFHVMMLPLRSKGTEMDAVEGITELVGAVRGFQHTLAPVLPSLIHTDLAPMVFGAGFDHELSNITDPKIENTDLPPNTLEALDALCAFQASEIPQQAQECFAKATQDLRDIVRTMATFGASAETGVVFVWLHNLDDNIVADIKSHKPQALLLLAYFAVFLSTLEKTYWFVRGWARRLVKQIEELLSERTRELEHLRWAVENVQRR